MTNPKQKFKSIYFQDFKDVKNNSKSFTLAFSEKDSELYESVKNLSSLEIRKVLNVDTYSELEKNAEIEGLPPSRYCIWKIKKGAKKEKVKKNKLPLFGLDPIHATFKGGKELPLQSWYPYLEGYSPDFVEYIIEHFVGKDAKIIYDPFSGSGTTPIIASSLNFKALFSEVNPLLQFLTKIKAKARNHPKKESLAVKLDELSENLEKLISECEEDQELKNSYPKIFKESKFFTDSILSNILKTKNFINNLYFKDTLMAELLTVATLASLIPSSLLKRQGDLRFKRDSELKNIEYVDLFNNIKINLNKIANDIRTITPSNEPILITEDARSIGKLPFLKIDAVITSPPYLNGTNYFRNTKIELWFLGYLKDNKDLSKYRKLAVTAGINDVSSVSKNDLKNKDLDNLLKIIEKEAYDKRIPKMIHDYFSDMEIIFRELKKQLNKNALLAIDLGDSIYGGVHVKTDEILISILKNIGYEFEKSIVLRKRVSNNGQQLKQVLLILKNKEQLARESLSKPFWTKEWNYFKTHLPHHTGDMAKRNWGSKLHSLCSYQGKLKPSIANQLVSIFVPEGGSMLDIFGGVGTLPLEATLQGKKSYSFDISPAAVIISRAKISKINKKEVFKIVDDLNEFIVNNNDDVEKLKEASLFGYNKKLKDYFHPETLKEIVSAREFFKLNGYDTGEKCFVLSSLLHILHGNRPYALSRTSHGITPFAPKGEFKYKNLIEKLKEKIERTLDEFPASNFKEGLVYFQDTTKTWPEEVRNIDAIITSPPFFDSTRFYLANWMRLWFTGWDDINFKTEPVNFIDELQKKDFSIYDNIFMQARERLKKNGVLVMHLGKSDKCDMAKILAERSKNWFKVCDVFEECVEDNESHGIRDKGTVVKHQYLVLN